MQTSEIAAKLISKGWTEASAHLFKEKVSQGATSYFTCRNNQDTYLGLAYFADSQEIKLKIGNANNQEFVWMKLEAKDQLKEVLTKLTDEQINILYSGYFNFYLTISAVCAASLLAWEQWENNYR